MTGHDRKLVIRSFNPLSRAKNRLIAVDLLPVTDSDIFSPPGRNAQITVYWLKHLQIKRPTSRKGT